MNKPHQDPLSKSPPVTPVLVSQANCLPVLGIPANQWSDRARASGRPWRRHGQLVLMTVTDALAAFRPEPSTPAAPPADPAESVRAALGLRRRGSR
jgi:hypothetical protein